MPNNVTLPENPDGEEGFLYTREMMEELRADSAAELERKLIAAQDAYSMADPVGYAMQYGEQRVSLEDLVASDDPKSKTEQALAAEIVQITTGPAYLKVEHPHHTDAVNRVQWLYKKLYKEVG
jgi:hypothetical protein